MFERTIIVQAIISRRLLVSIGLLVATIVLSLEFIIYAAKPGSTTAKKFRNCQRVNADDEWYNFTKNRSFILYPGLDSPGGNILVATNKMCLEELCRYTTGCIGFNSNGILKSSLLPFNNWTGSFSKKGGIHVLDIDHCSMRNNNCSQFTYCVSYFGGKYTCESIQDHRVLRDMPFLQVQDIAHLVVSVDMHESEGLVPLLQSVQLFSTKKVIFHIVTSANSKIHIEELISCSIHSSQTFQINVVQFDIPNAVQQMIVIRGKNLQYLDSSGNFARFFLSKIFPSLTHILYLDVDTIVLHDISELWRNVIRSDQLLSAVPRRKKMKSYFSSYVQHLYKKRHGKELKLSNHNFNAGVVGFNLKKWRENNLTEEAIFWIQMNKKKPLWNLGTQPVLYLLCGRDWNSVDHQWNVDGLGQSTYISKKTFSGAYILHWSGPGKPWEKRGQYIGYWWGYNKGICNRRGRCVNSSDGSWKCQCTQGYTGYYCEIRTVEIVPIGTSSFYYS